jgi:hypothetical protein
MALLLAAPAARAGLRFEDIEIVVEAEPKGDSAHGYFEYAFLLINHSADRSHTVTLRLPYDGRSRRYDSLSELKRTVEVGANESVRVTLLQPDFPPIPGSNMAVVVDGRTQENPVSLRLGETQRERYTSYRGFRIFHSSRPNGQLVLMSGSIRKSFRFVPAKGSSSGFGGVPATGSGMMAVTPAPPPSEKKTPRPAPPGPSPLLPTAADIITVQWRPETWSSNWLAYSRYDGIVVTGDDLRAMPPAVRTALWQYAETGGSLLVLGAAQLPESWQRRPDRAGLSVFEAGFGRCLVGPDENIDQWGLDRLLILNSAWADAAAPWQGPRESLEANREFPVVEDFGIPVGGLFVLMLLFTLAIGPVNYFILARKKRKIWLLWTAPLISLATCLAVFGYMLLSEGWHGRLRTETLTLLDESSRRATTIGWTAFYSPLTPSDGLHFSYETEVVPQRVDDAGQMGARSCTIDLSRDQHFVKGWVEARVPAHFKVRKSETRRERVAFHREADGKLSMVNWLGARVLHFWYADDKGELYAAQDVAAGAPAELTPADKLLAPVPVESPMEVLRASISLSRMDSFIKQPERYLTPRTYLAELDDSPFLEDGLRDCRTRRCRAVVLGMVKKDEKGE